MTLAAPNSATIEVVTSGSGVNEDLVGINHPRYWLFDGSTPLFGSRVRNAPSDARWFVERADEVLRRRLANYRVADLSREVESLARQLGREIKREGLPTGGKGVSAALGLVQVLEKQVDYFILGDIALLVESRRGTKLIRDERVLRFDQAAIKNLESDLARGVPYASAQRHMRAVLRKNREHLNTQQGYWVLSNRAAAAKHAFAGSIRTEGKVKILLATDGFARLAETFHLYGWRALFREAGRGRLHEMLDELRRAERGDPQSRTFPRLSPHDDASALYVTIRH